RDFTLLDTRNWYETELGAFEGAIIPNIKQISQLPDFVRQSNITPDKPVLMYCTGGIRCEKAATMLRRLGFPEIYQLKGGILRYLERFPHRNFKGDCFVFDHRVAVDQE